jgi:hypothetical protein
VSIGALAWLRYATFESVVPALQRGRSRGFVCEPLTLQTMWPGEAAFPATLLDDSNALFTEDDDDSDYVFDEEECEREEEQELKLELDEELKPESYDPWDVDAIAQDMQDLRQGFEDDWEQAVSSWNYLHWALSSLALVHEVSEAESSKFLFHSFMEEVAETISDSDNKELLSERCCVTGRTPLHCLFASALMEYRREGRKSSASLGDWVESLVRLLKGKGVDLALVDKANRNITDLFLR